MKTIFLLIIGIFCCSAAIAQDWIIAGISKDSSLWYIKSEYVSKQDGIIKLWVKVEMPTLKFKNDEYPNAQEKILFNFDCANQRTQSISVVMYDSSGSVINSESFGYQPYQDVVPDSIMEEILKKVCERFK